METLKQILQRLGWADDQIDNAIAALTETKEHLAITMGELQKHIDAADEPQPEPEPEPAPEYELWVWNSLEGDLLLDGEEAVGDIFVELQRADGSWTALDPTTSGDAPGVEKVEFYLDGELFNTETAYPYNMTGTTDGAPVATVLEPGSHTIGWKIYGDNPAEGTFSIVIKEEVVDPEPEPEPDPVPTGSNEPAGMIELYGDLGDTPGPNLCNDQPDSDYDEFGWRGQGFVKAVNAADSDIPPSPAPVDPDNFWEITWPEGWGADGFGSGAAGVTIYHSQYWTNKRAKSAYWQFYFYLPSDFETHPAMLKGWWFTHGGHTNHFVPMRSNLGNPGGNYFGSNDAFGCYLQFNANDTTRPAANIFYGGMSWSDVPRDQWIKLEMLFVANSDGDTADGKYRCWMNDELVSEHDDVHYFSPLNFELKEFFNRTSYGPVWGGGGDHPLSKEQSVGLDDWYVSYSPERVPPGSTTEPEPTPDPEPDPEPEPEPTDPEPPEETTTPTFTKVDGGVRVEWTEAAGADRYEVRWPGDDFFVTETFALVNLQDGDWCCIASFNGDVEAPDHSCATYTAEDAPTEPTPDPEPEPDPEPIPEPDPEPTGDWDLVLDFSLRKGEPVPDGLRFKEEQRTADGLLMVYPEGMRDGVGPGRVGIESNIMPQGFKNAMYQYDVTISPNFEDHIVFNKIAHYRFKPHPDGFGSKTIDKWKNYLLGYSSSSATASAGYRVKDIYPDHYAGYNSVHGNIRTDKFVAEQKHTVRCAWEWVRTDDDDTRINWYRLRWWLDGVLQGDFPEFPLLGGPDAFYWELAPTWGGNGGHIKTQEDWILFDNIKTWVK